MEKKASEQSQKNFYAQLAYDVEKEFQMVRDEWNVLHAMADELGRFEHKWLDNDRGTTGLEHCLRIGMIDLREEGGGAVAEKYGHLASTVYDATPLDIFEH